MGTLDALIRDLRKFEGRKDVVHALRKEIRQPLPAVRKAIKRAALDTLPRRGGLGVWVAKTRITTTIKLSGRSAGVKLKGGRSSTRGRSDIKAIDRGRVRAPSWGRRTRASWHTQSVPAGYFTDTAAKAHEWRAAAVKAVDKALETIARG